MDSIGITSVAVQGACLPPLNAEGRKEERLAGRGAPLDKRGEEEISNGCKWPWVGFP